MQKGRTIFLNGVTSRDLGYDALIDGILADNPLRVETHRMSPAECAEAIAANLL